MTDMKNGAFGRRFCCAVARLEPVGGLGHPGWRHPAPARSGHCPLLPATSLDPGQGGLRSLILRSRV